nr:uncharacterized protein LOC112435863 [Maylandia zebra]
MIAAMELLAKARSECQVRTENVYLFARPGVLSHYRGSDCFRKYANKCGAKYPEALTSTRLRKQVDTLSTVLNLKENEMDQLATFLGHDIRVHREFYRLPEPESTLRLAKVSKLLIAMEKGKLSDLQGKGLDDITINPDGSRTKNSGNQSRTLYSASLDNMEVSSASTTLDNMEGASASSTLDSKNISNTAPRKAGKARCKWTNDVMKSSCKVPGKKECDSCIQAEPAALKGRDWVAVKYYIHNRIITLKRKMNK